eukprot:2673600-Rhodomonas_salina.2
MQHPQAGPGLGEAAPVVRYPGYPSMIGRRWHGYAGHEPTSTTSNTQAARLGEGLGCEERYPFSGTTTTMQSRITGSRGRNS